MEFLNLQAMPRARTLDELTADEAVLRQYKNRRHGVAPYGVRCIRFNPAFLKTADAAANTARGDGKAMAEMAGEPKAELAYASGSKVVVKFKETGRSAALRGGDDVEISKFKDIVNFVAFRPSDGRLIVAGDAAGSCSVIDAHNGGVLRRLHERKKLGLLCGAFGAGPAAGGSFGGHVATGGRDRLLRLFDVSVSTGGASEPLMKFEHPDFVLSCASSSESNTWLTGCADGVVRMWDPRASSNRNDGAAGDDDEPAPQQAQLSFTGEDIGDTSAGVNQVQFLNGGLMCLSVRGNSIFQWDVRNAAKPVATWGQNHHTKHITDLAVCAESKTCASSSLDGTVRFWSLQTQEHLHCIFNSHKLAEKDSAGNKNKAKKAGDEASGGNQAVLSVDMIGPSLSGLEKIAIGAQNGVWCIKDNASVVEDKNSALSKAKRRKKELDLSNLPAGHHAAGTTRYYKRGPEQTRDSLIASSGALMGKIDSAAEVDAALAKKRLNTVDFYLKKFEYKKALEYVLTNGGPNTGANPFSLLDELSQRGALAQTCSQLSSRQLKQVLSFASNKLSDGTASGEALAFRQLVFELIDKTLACPENQKKFVLDEEDEKVINGKAEQTEAGMLQKLVADISEGAKAELNNQDKMQQVLGILDTVLCQP